MEGIFLYSLTGTSLDLTKCTAQNRGPLDLQSNAHPTGCLTSLGTNLGTDCLTNFAIHTVKTLPMSRTCLLFIILGLFFH